MGFLRNLVGTLLGNPVSATKLLTGTSNKNAVGVALGNPISVFKSFTDRPSTTTVVETRDPEEPKKGGKTFGCVNNKKGFTFTYDATAGNRCYSVCTQDTSTGSQAIIRTFHNTVGENLIEGKTLIPNIPYRIIFNDNAWFNTHLKESTLKQPIAGGELLFNPGVDAVGSTLTMPTAFTNGNTKYIEFNIERDQIKYITNEVSHSVQSNGSNYLSQKINSLFASDTQASIQVKLDSSDPDLYDWLYLSVTARVDVWAEQNFNGNSEYKHQFYAVPIVLKYQITKASLTNTGKLKINPTSWGYPLSNDRTSTANRITSTVSDSGFENDLWNYRIISGHEVNGIFFPVQYGCITDSTYVSTNTIGTHTCFGKCYSDITNPDTTTNPYRQKNSINKMVFGTNSFVKPTLSKVIDNNPLEYTVASHLACEYVDSHYVTLKSSYTIDKWTKTDQKKYLQLTIHDSSLVLKSLIMISDCGYGDLIVNNGELHFKYTNLSSEMKMFKFPTIDGTFLNTIGSFNRFTSTQADNFFKANLTYEVLDFESFSYGGYPSIDFRLAKAKENHLVDVKTQDTSSIEGAGYIKGSAIYVDVNDNMAMIHIDAHDHPDMHAYRFKDLSTPVSDKAPNGWTIGYIKSKYDDGFGSGHYGYADIKAIAGVTDIKVKKFAPAEITLGNAVVEYWRDPVFGEEEYTGIAEEDRTGTRLMINITGCFGIYSKIQPLTINSFDTTLTPRVSDNEEGGIEIDKSTRPDINFRYGGRQTSYKELYTSWGGGYTALIESPVKVSFKNSGGDSLLFGGDTEKNVQGSVWHYDDTGYFNLYVPLTLDMNNAGGLVEYTHPDFAISGCIMNVKVLNNTGGIIASKELSIDINPPNSDGSISTVNNIYKTIQSTIAHTWQREQKRNASDYTELWNITNKSINVDTGFTQSTNPYSFKNNGVANGSITIANNLPRGSYYWIEYEPKLHGIKPGTALNNGIAVTNCVTNCIGARYNISDAELYIGVTGLYGSDIMSTISSSNPYLYINSEASGVTFKTILNVTHEDWDITDFESARPQYSGNQVYPAMSGIYMVAVTKTSNFLDYFVESKFTPYDNVSTYPNIEVDNNIIKQLWTGELSLEGVTATGEYLPGTGVLLVDKVMTVNIEESDNYRLFVSIEDEFGQFSNWCLTNPTTYNFPLGN